MEYFLFMNKSLNDKRDYYLNILAAGIMMFILLNHKYMNIWN